MDERRKISELPSNDSPSTSTVLVGVDGNDTVKIPITEFVTKDEDGNVTLNDSLDVNGSITCNDGITSEGTLEVTYGNPIRVWNDDNTKSVSLFCSADGGKIETNTDTLATESYVDEKVANISSGVSGYYDCTVHAGSTMRDLLNDLKSKGYTSGDTMLLRVRESVWAGNYVGYIKTWADNTVCEFYLLDIGRATLYTYPGGVDTSTDLSFIFGDATRTELGNSSDAGLPYVGVLWNNPMTDMLDKITEYVSSNSPQKTIEQDDTGKLNISNYSNGDNPISRRMTPLYGIDLWEHAYYLDYQNRRNEHVRKLWDIIDWEMIESRLTI